MIPVGNKPQGVAIAVDGTFAYVANPGSGTVSRIRTSDDAITATVTVGSEPVDVAMAAGGTFLRDERRSARSRGSAPPTTR